MSVAHVEVLVEEPSMEAALRALLPRLLTKQTFEVQPHQGKDELLERLPARLRGYAQWLPEDWRIVVVLDRDDADCLDLKRRLDAMVSDAGLRPRSKGAAPYQVVTRLAIEELEAWYFGDWKAVKAAYPRVKSTITSQAKYRSSDAISGGTWEALERVLKAAGYFRTGLRKIEAARAIAEHMDPLRNTSASFRALRDVLNEFASSSA